MNSPPPEGAERASENPQVEPKSETSDPPFKIIHLQPPKLAINNFLKNSNENTTTPKES